MDTRKIIKTAYKNLYEMPVLSILSLKSIWEKTYLEQYYLLLTIPLF